MKQNPDITHPCPNCGEPHTAPEWYFNRPQFCQQCRKHIDWENGTAHDEKPSKWPFITRPCPNCGDIKREPSWYFDLLPRQCFACEKFIDWRDNDGAGSIHDKFPGGGPFIYIGYGPPSANTGGLLPDFPVDWSKSPTARFSKEDPAPEPEPEQLDPSDWWKRGENPPPYNPGDRT